MNQAAETYWKTFWKGKDMPASVSAWQFGTDPDKIAQLVIDGIKTATCSAYIFYELENEKLPSAGEYSIVLNGNEEPVCIIETVEVTIIPMNEVTPAFAAAEGEGDRTYQYWKQVHEAFFRRELEGIGREFSEDMPLVCERFRLVDVKK